MATTHPAQPTASPARPRRRFATGLFVAMAGVVAVLSFADRASGLASEARRASVRFTQALEDLTGFGLIDARDVPYGSDVIGHFALWFVVAVVGWWAFAQRLSATTLAFVLFVAAYGSEIGQSYLTTTRTPDPRDLIANTFGIAAGLTIAVGVQRMVLAVRRIGSPKPAAARG